MIGNKSEEADTNAHLQCGIHCAINWLYSSRTVAGILPRTKNRCGGARLGPKRQAGVEASKVKEKNRGHVNSGSRSVEAIKMAF